MPALCLLCALCLLAAGCGQSGDGGEALEESVTLADPEPIVTGRETVMRRNLYNAQVYEVIVNPYTEEYSFPERQIFGAYHVFAGDRVEAGTLIASAEEGAWSGQMEQLEEKLLALTEDHEKDLRKTEETLETQREELERLEELLEDLEEGEPEEYLTQGGGERKPNPAYTAWQKEYRRVQGQRNLYEFYIDSGEEKLRQRTQLYELDLEYYGSQLRELREREKSGAIRSRMSGVILSRSAYSAGSVVLGGWTAALVGDLERRILRCSAIEDIWSKVRGCKDLYAFFHGRRVEIAYEEDSQAGYSDFRLLEDDGVEVGDYGVVVIVSDVREQVPAVSVDAIYADGRRRYVYVLENGKSVVRDVETGMSDGVYTEILSGLEEGEEVLVQGELPAGGGRSAVLARGDSCSRLQEEAEVYYPVRQPVKNPVESGTTFFQECQVAEGQRIEEGAVVVSVRVEGDSHDIARREIELKRAKERLADLAARGREEDEEAAAGRQKEIARMEEELEKLVEDYGTTAVCAGISGLIEKVTEHEKEDVLKPDENVAVIADIRRGYLMVNSYQLDYGDELEVAYTDWDGNSCTTRGKVVSLRAVPRKGVSMSRGMLVALPEGEIQKIRSYQENSSGVYEEVKARVSGVARVMENVVKVPKEAVSTIEGHTYVNLLWEDGTVTPVSFLAGGMDDEFCWAVHGLTEGMTICWE